MLPLVPAFKGTYHEPFVGGGALFFAMRPGRSVLSDTNARLVRTFRALRDSPEDVITRLNECPNNKEYFFTQRERLIDCQSDVDVAVWMIYLNRTAFNGLYRVNRDNRFNVPFGRHIRPRICDEVNLRACSSATKHSEILCEPFESVEARAEPGDFVYFDPPTPKGKKASNSESLSESGFTPDNYKTLRDIALRLKKNATEVLVSCQASPIVYELFNSDFIIHEVESARETTGETPNRNRVPALLIR